MPYIAKNYTQQFCLWSFNQTENQINWKKLKKWTCELLKNYGRVAAQGCHLPFLNIEEFWKYFKAVLEKSEQNLQ